MKKIELAFLVVFSLMLFVRCDKIEGPYMEREQSVAVDTPYFEVKTDFFRKFLLEDYTGQSCRNCPKAHTIMHQLQSGMGDTLVCMAVHSGGYAVPADAPYTADYRTEIGNTWNSYFSVSQYPSGMINRQVMANGNRVLAYTLWKKVMDTLSRTSPEIGLQIRDTSLATVQDTDYVFVKVSYLKESSRNLRLYVVLLEDSIVSPQLNGINIDTNYVHNHMLRGNLSPLQGSMLNDGELLENGTATIRAYALYRDSKWIWKHCSILAFVCDADSEEVLQVEKMSCGKQ